MKCIEHGNSLIIPILSIITKCRESIKLATTNELDVLHKEEFKTFRITSLWYVAS